MKLVSRRVPIAILSTLFACLCALVLAMPHSAYADVLKATSLQAQAANNTIAKATEIKLNTSASVQYDADDLDGVYAYYWFKYMHGNRNSVYTVHVESVDGSQVDYGWYDQDYNRLSGTTIYSSKPSFTGYDVIKSSSQKNKWRYVRLSIYYRNANYGDQFRVTVKEHPVLKQVTGLKVAKKTKSSIKLKWSQQGNAAKYEVAWRPKNGNWKYTTVKTNVKKFAHLKKNRAYQFAVRAYCKDGWDSVNDETGSWGAWSAVKTVKTKK